MQGALTPCASARHAAGSHMRAAELCCSADQRREVVTGGAPLSRASESSSPTSSPAIQSQSLNGLLDEVRVWPYARSEEQIAANYRLTVDVEAEAIPPSVYWRLDSGEGIGIGIRYRGERLGSGAGSG